MTSPEGGGNGFYRELKEIKAGVDDIRDDLKGSIERLATAVDRLGDKFEMFIKIAERSVPLKAVFLLLGMMILGLVGVEGVKSLTFLPGLFGVGH